MTLGDSGRCLLVENVLRITGCIQSKHVDKAIVMLLQNLLIVPAELSVKMNGNYNISNENYDVISIIFYVNFNF
jgi:hypothetical protein